MATSFQTEMLRDALVILSFPPAEQLRLSGPGCLTCDMYEDYQLAWKTVQHDTVSEFTSEQLRALETISQALDALNKDDRECFSAEAVHRPAWQAIREQATDALRLFGWQNSTIGPFTETAPGVWTRSTNSET